MASTIKKGSKNKKARLRYPTVTSLAEQAQTIPELRRQLAESLQRENATASENMRLFERLTEKSAELDNCYSELHQSSERQMVTSEILRVIASSSTNVQSVLDTVAASAARLCEAIDAVIFRREGSFARAVAWYGSMPRTRPPGEKFSDTRGTPVGRAMLDRVTIHVHDITVEFETEYPNSKERHQISGSRTILATPLLREGDCIGAIMIRRTEVRPFSDKQIKLLETFADQAVIAIENARLFQELREALEQQTATSEILGVIASSPTDIQPVLNTVAENAARLCEAPDAQIRLVQGEGTKLVASFGPSAAPDFVLTRTTNPTGKALLERRPIHVEDLVESAKTEFPESLGILPRTRTRTFLAVPMLKEETPIGAIAIRRTEVRPFSEKHIALLKTFADQAVIAIENVRLFKELQDRNAELREALEHQTATSEVLSIISRSPTDVQPVLDAIVESAARVCGIDDVTLRLRERDALVRRAHFGPILAGRVEISVNMPQVRWIRDHGTLHIPDVSEQNDFQILSIAGARTFLIVPLRQKGELVGALSARRTEVRPFTPAQIKLLETFANQAVIAIENVRLFRELKESLEQQTATSEILGVIASSPTDIQPVLDVVAENAARVCGANDAVIFRVNGNVLDRAAHYGPILWMGGEESLLISRGSVSGRAVVDRRTTHIHDMAAESEAEFPEGLRLRDVLGIAQYWPLR